MKKVMIVDDDEAFLEETTETLKMSGYDTIALSRCDAVLKMACVERPDVILLDLKIAGGSSGFKVADELKHSPETAHIPIIIITGVYTAEEQMLLIKTCGLKTRLIKPIKPIDLIFAIEHCR